ncbi:MAG: cation-translocating P-type ATPase [Desulfobacterales bacterium]|nr:cation-translocating P-type ATPase [Desulfobacterales bacterium]
MRSNAFTADYGERTYRYCCAGCRMVFAMLMEATESPDPNRFKQSELYRRCVAAGVVPASAAELAGLSADGPARAAPAPDEAAHLLPFEEQISGMWCPACAWVIAAAVGRLTGVAGVRCDFSTDRMRGSYDPVRTTPQEIRRAVQALGYGIAAETDGEGRGPWRREFVRLIVSALLSVNVMMLSWALYSGFFTTLGSEGIGFISWPIVVMATAVMAYGGGPLLRKAWSGLRHGAPGMELLIALGAGSAYLYSLVNWQRGSLHLYFDTAAMLVTLLLLGKWLEARAKERVRRDLEGFLALRPTKVRIWNQALPQGRYAAAEQLMAGDCFLVVPDEVVPADGRVVAGGGRVDASAVTGEPRPVALGVGDSLVSGCRLIEGRIVARAERVGAEALLGRMIDVVTACLSQKGKWESRTDRILRWFVPLIALLALATGLLAWAFGLAPEQALVRAVTVLVIACPCALGIAIPLARVAGVAGAGRQGLLVRDFAAFEQAGRIDTLILDKTGTVTHGRWRVTRMAVASGISAEQALALACGLEEGIDHTVARAIDAYGRAQGVAPRPVTQREAHPEGIAGCIQEGMARIGTRRFAAGNDDTESMPPEEGSAQSEVLLGVDGRPWARFYFGDSLRDGMRDLVAALEAAGKSVLLVSGDTQAATRHVATAIGVRQAHGDLLPQAKADRVRRLQTEGRRVAMVGDGINDAPALAQADLGVAVYNGTALAQHAAALTLMAGNPAQLQRFFPWAARVERTVRQNLWCALGYNMISLPIAMAGLLTPLVAAAAMLLSSLTVIGNTFRLVRR